MTFRINVITACLAGCVVSVLVAIWLMLRFESAFLAFLPTIFFPPLSCWLGGLRRRDNVLMIVIFATIGWFAGTAFTPVVALGPQAQIQRKSILPFAGADPIVPCALCGSIFAFGRACFIGSPELKNGNTIKESKKESTRQ